MAHLNIGRIMMGENGSNINYHLPIRAVVAVCALLSKWNTLVACRNEHGVPTRRIAGYLISIVPNSISISNQFTALYVV